MPSSTPRLVLSTKSVRLVRLAPLGARGFVPSVFPRPGWCGDGSQCRRRAWRAVASSPDLTSEFYVDGHVRAYQGGGKVATTHLSRLKFPAPATVETWVSDAAGDPVLVVMAQPRQARCVPDDGATPAAPVYRAFGGDTIVRRYCRVKES